MHHLTRLFSLLLPLVLTAPIAKAEVSKPNIIYILADDLGETQDVAAQHPKIVDKAHAIFKEARRPAKLFPNRLLDRR